MNRRSGSSRRGRRRGRRNDGATGARPAASSRSDTASTSIAEPAAEEAADAEVAAEAVTDTVHGDAADEVTEVAEVTESPAAEPEVAEITETAAPEPEVAEPAAQPEVTEAPDPEPAPAAAAPAEAAPPAVEPAEPPAPAVAAPVELERGELGDEEYDEYESEDASSWVRPYVWTGGRTDTSLDFALETLVSARKALAQPDEAMRDEHRRVLELCDKPRSVTEIAALLSVPLGVAKTLLGAMAEEDMLVVHRDGRTGPDLALMERVLRGLKNL